jgi:hypothetical protein
MRRFLLFVVLLSHINAGLFIPCVEETDMYTNDGTQKDDINSVAEYFYEVALGHKDKTPEDEDDDQPHYYLLAKSTVFNFQQQHFKILAPQFSITAKKEYPVFNEQDLPTTYIDINTPPPDRTA